MRVRASNTSSGERLPSLRRSSLTGRYSATDQLGVVSLDVMGLELGEIDPAQVSLQPPDDSAVALRRPLPDRDGYIVADPLVEVVGQRDARRLDVGPLVEVPLKMVPVPTGSAVGRLIV